MTEWSGRQLARVRINRRIGRGGMADVYLGDHTTLSRQVAVKVLHAHLLDDSNLIRRFRAEAQAVAALRHPNIVQVHDFDVIDGRPYIIMELLEGPSLSDHLRTLAGSGRGPELETVVRIVDDLAAALDYAHDKGIIHRDVNPNNVMLRAGASPLAIGEPLPEDFQAVLTDFGVARITYAGTVTRAGTLLGTPAYMSPEQVTGGRVDGRADVYSLGVMIYQMISGKLPFEIDPDAPGAVLFKHVKETAPPLPGANRSVQEVVARALSKDPENRYLRSGDLADALRRAAQAADEVIAAGAAPVRPRPGRDSRRPLAAAPARRQWAGRAVLLSLLGVAGLVLGGLAFNAGALEGILSGGPGGTEPPALVTSTTAPIETPLSIVEAESEASPSEPAPTATLTPTDTPPPATALPTNTPQPTAAPTRTPRPSNTPPPPTATPTTLIPPLPTLDL